MLLSLAQEREKALTDLSLFGRTDETNHPTTKSDGHSGDEEQGFGCEELVEVRNMTIQKQIIDFQPRWRHR